MEASGFPTSPPGGELPLVAEGPGPDRRTVWVIVALVGGVLVVLGILSRGTNLFGALSQRRGSPVSAFGRALIGAGIGAVVAGLVMLVIRALRPPEQRRGLRNWLPLALLVAVGLGALTGAATTPLDRSKDGEQLSKEEQRQEDLRPTGDRASEVLRTVDQDGDGKPDRDAQGNLIFGQDVDGDGRADNIYISCDAIRAEAGQSGNDASPGGSPDGPPPTTLPRSRPLPPSRQPGDGELIAIDDNCDGVIERYLVFKKGTIGVDGSLPPLSGREQPSGRQSTPEVKEPDNPETSKMSLGSILKWFLALLVIAGLVALMVSIVRHGGLGGLRGMFSRERRRRKRPAAVEFVEDAPEPSANEAVAAAFTSTIDLLGHPDPRVAINAAYAQLLDGLAGIGLGRRDHEAPQEHLDRVLASAPIDRAATRRLVEVFALARFSNHPVTEDHRETALTALRTIAGQLSAVGAGQ